MKKLKDNGCVVILLIGLTAGLITGFIVGVNVSAWNYAGIIAQGYTEIIRTHDNQMFATEKGILYKLEPVKSKKENHDDIIDAIEEHDKKTIK